MPGPVLFQPSNQIRTLARFYNVGAHVLRLRVSAGAASGADEVTVSVVWDDDGKPNPPGLVTVQWTRVNGPTAVTIEGERTTRATVRFTSAGTYGFRVTASDGALSASDEVRAGDVVGGSSKILSGTSVSSPGSWTCSPGAVAMWSCVPCWSLPPPPSRVRRRSTVGASA
jgi:hypothetical protein